MEVLANLLSKEKERYRVLAAGYRARDFSSRCAKRSSASIRSRGTKFRPREFSPSCPREQLILRDCTFYQAHMTFAFHSVYVRVSRDCSRSLLLFFLPAILNSNFHIFICAVVNVVVSLCFSFSCTPFFLCTHVRCTGPSAFYSIFFSFPFLIGAAWLLLIRDKCVLHVFFIIFICLTALDFLPSFT